MSQQFVSYLKAGLLSVLLCLLFVQPVKADEDEGYEWAEENSATSFEECQQEFGTSSEEDGCNKYVREQNYGGSLSFNGDECTEDCSGHEAGYEWAEENGIDDVDDCEGNSQSFVEGCESYVSENE